MTTIRRRGKQTQKATIGFLLVFAPAMAIGCNAGTDTKSMVEPGESRRDLGYIGYDRSPAAGSEGDPKPLTACSLVANGHSIVIADIAADHSIIKRRDDCSGPYGASTTLSVPVEIVAVAAGLEAPERLNVLAVGGGGIEQRPKPGETWLFALRPSNGEWFLTNYAKLEFSDERIDSARVADLPGTFEELSVETMARLDDFDAVCTEDAVDRVTDEEFANLMYETDFWGCSPPGVEEPQDLPGGPEDCTDDNPCD